MIPPKPRPDPVAEWFDTASPAALGKDGERLVDPPKRSLWQTPIHELFARPIEHYEFRDLGDRSEAVVTLKKQGIGPASVLLALAALWVVLGWIILLVDIWPEAYDYFVRGRPIRRGFRPHDFITGNITYTIFVGLLCLSSFATVRRWPKTVSAVIDPTFVEFRVDGRRARRVRLSRKQIQSIRYFEQGSLSDLHIFADQGEVFYLSGFIGGKDRLPRLVIRLGKDLARTFRAEWDEVIVKSG